MLLLFSRSAEIEKSEGDLPASEDVLNEVEDEKELMEMDVNMEGNKDVDVEDDELLLVSDNEVEEKEKQSPVASQKKKEKKTSKEELKYVLFY